MNGQLVCGDRLEFPALVPVVRDYLFDLFDFPSPSLVSGRRSVTNVPSQALYLRNSTFVAEQAKHAAELVLREAADDVDRVDLAMLWTLAREATDAERAGALQLIQQVRQAGSEDAESDVNAWAAWFHTTASGPASGSSLHAQRNADGQPCPPNCHSNSTHGRIPICSSLIWIMGALRTEPANGARRP